jgi:hypothetical protein
VDDLNSGAVRRLNGHPWTSAFAGVMLRVGLAETNIAHRAARNGSVRGSLRRLMASGHDPQCDQRIRDCCDSGPVALTSRMLSVVVR